MSAIFGKLFRRRTRSIPAHIADPVLGKISFSEQFHVWTADVPIDKGIIEFVLAGDDHAPTDAVLAHAGQLVRDFSAFQGRVGEFLAREALEFPRNSDEIRQLQIACINLPFPDRPRDGEIRFSGPGDSGVWHCRYRDGKPFSLGFDD